MKRPKDIRNSFNAVEYYTHLDELNKYIDYLEKQNKQLNSCAVGKELNGLKEINSIIEKLPKLKVLYNGQVSYDGINYMSIDDLINKLEVKTK